MDSIGTILNTFFVSCVYNRKKDVIHLEVIGSKVNIQIAEYVAEVLEKKLDELWNEAKQEHKLKGLIAKNSFFRGIASGYVDKIQSLKSSYSGEVSRSLMVIEGKLKEAVNVVCGRLTYTSSSSSVCGKASELGHQAGRSLNINPGVESSQGGSGELIEHKN